MLKRLNGCKKCAEKLTTRVDQHGHLLIQAKRCAPDSLLFSSARYARVLDTIDGMISKSLTKYCLRSNVAIKIKNLILQEVDFSSLFCEKHENFKNYLVYETARLSIFAWINFINKIIKGIDLQFNTQKIGDPYFTDGTQKILPKKKIILRQA